MSGNHYPRWVRCNVCDEMVLTTAPRAMCPECKQQRAHERAILRSMHYKPTIDADAYIVIYDPIPVEDGGFKKGAVINREEMMNMLHPVCSSFTIGTKLTNKLGDVFVVVKGKRGGLKLVAI